jgi:hypothetical protein
MATHNSFPLVRIHPAAHKHLSEISEALNKAGRHISMTALASEAILSIPMPNGNNQSSIEAQSNLFEFPPKPMATDPGPASKEEKVTP